MAKSKVRIELISSGVADVLRSGGVVGAVGAAASGIAARAGPGYASSAVAGRRRALGMVWADTPAAWASERKNRTLTRALGGG